MRSVSLCANRRDEDVNRSIAAQHMLVTDYQHPTVHQIGSIVGTNVPWSQLGTMIAHNRHGYLPHPEEITADRLMQTGMPDTQCAESV